MQSVLSKTFPVLCDFTSPLSTAVSIHFSTPNVLSLALALFLYTEQMSFPDLLRALRLSVTIMLLTSFSLIQTISCTSIHYLPYCHPFFPCNLCLILLPTYSYRNQLISLKFRFPDLPLYLLLFVILSMQIDLQAQLFSSENGKNIHIGLPQDQMR